MFNTVIVEGIIFAYLIKKKLDFNSLEMIQFIIRALYLPIDVLWICDLPIMHIFLPALKKASVDQHFATSHTTC